MQDNKYHGTNMKTLIIKKRMVEIKWTIYDYRKTQRWPRTLIISKYMVIMVNTLVALPISRIDYNFSSYPHLM